MCIEIRHAPQKWWRFALSASLYKGQQSRIWEPKGVESTSQEFQAEESRQRWEHPYSHRGCFASPGGGCNPRGASISSSSGKPSIGLSLHWAIPTSGCRFIGLTCHRATLPLCTPSIDSKLGFRLWTHQSAKLSVKASTRLASISSSSRYPSIGTIPPSGQSLHRDKSSIGTISPSGQSLHRDNPSIGAIPPSGYSYHEDEQCPVLSIGQHSSLHAANPSIKAVLFPGQPSIGLTYQSTNPTFE